MQAQECVNSLKNKLYIEIQNFEKSKKESEILESKISFLEEIIHVLDGDDYEEIEENKLQLAFLLPDIYDEIEGNRIYDMIMMSVYYLKNQEKLSESDKDLQTALLKYKNLQKKFKSDLEEKSNQLQFLKTKLHSDKPYIIECRKIQSNLKYEGLVTPRQFSLIAKVMESYQMDSKDQIRTLEYIRIHNARVQYENPKVSYTVMKMLDEAYEKYEIDELDEKAYQKDLLSVYESFYDSIRKEDALEEIISIMPNLSDGSYTLDEFDYIYKNILNRMMEDLEENIRDRVCAKIN